MKNSSFLLFIVIAIMIGIGACAKVIMPASAGAVKNQLLATAKPVTPSPVPTITPQYQLTAQAAQQAQGFAVQTSDAAMLQILQVTAVKEANELQQLQLTESSAQLTAQVDQWTATAAPTAVIGTITAAALDRTIVQAQITLASGGLTATHAAPTQLIAMQRAQDEVDHAPLFFIVQMFAFLAFSFCMFGIGSFALMSGRIRQKQAIEETRAPVKIVANYVKTPEPEEDPITEEQAPVETVLRVQTVDTQYPSMDRMTVPCTPEQFDILVTGILQAGKTLAYEFWNKRESHDKPAPFTRDEFTLVRNWLLSNRLAQSAGKGALMLSATGENIFIEWLNSQTLPENYKFEEMESVNEKNS